MVERAKDKEPELELPEDEGPEHLDEQVQRAHEQLVVLKRQQEQIEKQKRELEELSKRQEQLQQGKAEMVEQFTRALVVVERETYDAQRRVEQLKGVHESFIQHLDTLEAINPKSWDNLDINKELNRALSAVDDARAEFARSRAAINAESPQEVLPPVMTGDAYQEAFGATAQHEFMYWLKSGFAFTLPLLIFGIVLLFVMFAIFSKR